MELIKSIKVPFYMGRLSWTTIFFVHGSTLVRYIERLHHISQTKWFLNSFYSPWLGAQQFGIDSIRFFFYWNSSEPSFAWLRARGNGMPRSAYQWGINDSLFFLRLRSDAIEILSNPTGSGSDVTGPIEESVDIHEVVQMTCYPIKTDTIHVKAVKSFEKKPYQIGFLFIQSQTKGEHSNLFFFWKR